MRHVTSILLQVNINLDVVVLVLDIHLLPRLAQLRREPQLLDRVLGRRIRQDHRCFPLRRLIKVYLGPPRNNQRVG